MSLTKPRYSGSITFSENEQPPVKRGSVLISGVSPRAKVSILDFDGSDSGQQIDVMRDVRIIEEEKTGKIILTGKSLHAVKRNKLSGRDAVVTVTVDVKKCKDCPG